MVSNVVIITYGARWVLDSSEGSLCKLYKHLTATCTSETQNNIECQL